MISKETREKIKFIVKKIVNYDDTIVFKTSCEENIIRIIYIIRYDYVVTFHLGDISYSYNQNDKTVILKPNYLYKKQEYNLIMQKILDKLTVIKNDLSKMNNEIEKELYIHDFLCKSVIYKDVGNNSHSIVGPLLFQEGVCEGIAKTAHILFKLANIESIVICGKSINERNIETDHAWNGVRIDGKWHLLDITFDNTLSNNGFIRYDYFNVSANELRKSHIPCKFQKKEFENCIEKSSYFGKKGIEFYNENAAFEYIEKAIHKKSKIIYIKICYCKDKIEDLGIIDYVLKMKEVKNVKYSINENMKVVLLKIEYNNFAALFNFYRMER